MPALSVLSLPQIVSLKRILERFFYRIGINIAFQEASSSQEYGRFKTKVEKAIKKQILPYATIDRVEEVLGVKKVATMRKRLLVTWVILTAILDEEEIDDYMRYAGEFGGNVAYSKLDLTGHYTLEDKVLKQLEERRDFLVSAVDETTQDWIVKTITGGIERGLSHRDIAKLIRDNASQVAGVRAGKIADTELMYAMNMVEWQVYKNMGVKQKRWVTSFDERVCLVCMGNEDAGLIGIDDSFPSGDMFPLAHIGCRCFLDIK